jgi:hypothetical protein
MKYEVLIYGEVPQRIEVDAQSGAEATDMALEMIFERLNICAQKVGEEKCRPDDQVP